MYDFWSIIEGPSARRAEEKAIMQIQNRISTTIQRPESPHQHREATALKVSKYYIRIARMLFMNVTEVPSNGKTFKLIIFILGILLILF